MRVVDQSETRALATTVLCPETENADLVLVGFVEFGEFASEFVLGDIGSVGVEDINDHLSSAEQLISNELARAQCNRLIAVGHDCGMRK